MVDRSAGKWVTAAAALVGLVCLMALGQALAESGPKAPAAGAPVAAAPAAPAAPAAVGYDDTPFLPDGKWRVHDSKRPLPRVVTPPTASTPDRPGLPPSDAVVLFDGKDLSRWEVSIKGQVQPAQWKVENGYMEVVAGKGSIYTKEKFGDCQIHVEWAAPAEVKGSSQGRGNSGVLIMGRYEVQVVDSWENPTYADGGAASLYGQYPPLVNASRKPGDWQTFDIVFEAPRFEGAKVARPATATVFHNGIVVHNRQPILGSMFHRQVGKYAPHAPELPLMLQEHANPVRYRNIWVRRLTGYDGELLVPPAAK